MLAGRRGGEPGDVSLGISEQREGRAVRDLPGRQHGAAAVRCDLLERRLEVIDRDVEDRVTGGAGGRGADARR